MSIFPANIPRCCHNIILGLNGLNSHFLLNQRYLIFILRIILKRIDLLFITIIISLLFLFLFNNSFFYWRLTFPICSSILYSVFVSSGSRDCSFWYLFGHFFFMTDHNLILFCSNNFPKLLVFHCIDRKHRYIKSTWFIHGID